MEQDRLELFRKIPHMLLGLLYFFIYMWLGYSIPFVIGSIFFLIVTVICIQLVKKYTWWQELFRKMIRKDNPIKGIGVFTYFLGIFISCVIQFQWNLEIGILVCAIVTLSIGDGIATIVGKSKLGSFKSRHYPKSYSGMIIGILLSVFISYVIIHVYGFTMTFKEILLYCSIGMIIEFLLISKKSHEWCLDNFLIPIGIILISMLIL